MMRKVFNNYTFVTLALVVFIVISCIESYFIYKLSIQNKEQELFKRYARDEYENSIILHPYNISILNFDVDLTDVKLKYKTFDYKTINLGDLPALDITKTSDENRNRYKMSQYIEDMASPIYFEVTGTRKDGTIFSGNVSGFDIRQNNETFEVYIDKGVNELRYH